MKPIKNRITKLLGIDFPIIQAPMGWIARSKLASAVSNSGGLGIIETSSGELKKIKEEIEKYLILGMIDKVNQIENKKNVLNKNRIEEDKKISKSIIK